MTHSTLPPECESCGYELTGMKIGEACPECGGTITRLEPGVRGRRLALWSACLGLAALSAWFLSVLVPSGYARDRVLTVLILSLGTGGMLGSIVARKRIEQTTLGHPDLEAARIGFYLSGFALFPMILWAGSEIEEFCRRQFG